MVYPWGGILVNKKDNWYTQQGWMSELHDEVTKPHRYIMWYHLYETLGKTNLQW